MMLETIGLIYIIGMVMSFFMSIATFILMAVSGFEDFKGVSDFLSLGWLVIVATFSSWVGFLFSLFFCFGIIEDWK